MVRCLIDEHLSPNVDERPDGSAVDCLILHYTGMKTADSALARLCDPEAKVSAHYLIDEDGRTVQLVSEKHRAWHAGVSVWQGRERLNDCSIGIEVVNPGHEWGYRPFTEAQYQVLECLCLEIMKRWLIPPHRVLAHSDVAPARKLDPGELFDWRRLAVLGIGVWPEEGRGHARSNGTTWRQLRQIGYGRPRLGNEEASLSCVVRAFQRRFRPECVDGRLDWQTLARLDGLLALADERER